MSVWSRFKYQKVSFKRLVFICILSTIVLLCGIPIYLVETLIQPKKASRSAEHTYTPFELGLPAETVRFSPRDGGYCISGWFIPRPGATTTLLVCPGYRTGKADVLGISRFLWEAGHNVLIFEYYGHGAEVGTSVTLGYREMQDFLGAIDYVKQHAPHTQIGVLAYSMGASIAIMCSRHTPEVKAIVADSAFASHRSVIDYNIRRVLHLSSAPFIWLADLLLGWRAGYHFRQVEPLRDIMHISSRPILIIHGGKDRVVDPCDALQLYRAAQGPKELWLVPEAEHCEAYFIDRSAYVEKVVAFFKEALEEQSAFPHLVEFIPAECIRTGGHRAQRRVSRPPKTVAA